MQHVSNKINLLAVVSFAQLLSILSLTYCALRRRARVSVIESFCQMLIKGQALQFIETLYF